MKKLFSIMMALLFGAGLYAQQPDENDLKKAKRLLSWLTNASILLDRPDNQERMELYRLMTSLSKQYTDVNISIQMERYGKLDLAIKMLTEAINNN